MALLDIGLKSLSTVSKGYRITEKKFWPFFLSFKEESFKAKVAVHKIKTREQLFDSN